MICIFFAILTYIISIYANLRIKKSNSTHLRASYFGVKEQHVIPIIRDLPGQQKMRVFRAFFQNQVPGIPF